MLQFGRPRNPQIGTLRVDPYHSLARNLHDCVVFNVAGQHGLVNLAAPNFNVVQVGQGTGVLPTGWVVTQDGVAAITVGTSDGLTGSQINIANQGQVTAGDCAFRIRFILNGFAASYPSGTLLSKVNGPRELGLFVASSTQIISRIDLGVALVTPLGNAIPLGAVHDIVVTKTAGVGTMYQNGVATATSLSLSGTASASAAIFVGNDNGQGGNSLSASFFQLQTWTRPLTAAEVLQLYLDPFCFMTTAPPLQINQTFSFPPPPTPPIMGQIWI